MGRKLTHKYFLILGNIVFKVFQNYFLSSNIYHTTSPRRGMLSYFPKSIEVNR